MNTILTCLRWNGEHEDVDQGQNQHRQQHGQHQQGGTSPEGDFVSRDKWGCYQIYEKRPHATHELPSAPTLRWSHTSPRSMVGITGWMLTVLFESMLQSNSTHWQVCAEDQTGINSTLL